MDDKVWNPMIVRINGVRVTWSEKYGQVKTIDCIGLWETDQEYMLTWRDGKRITLQKCNVNSIEYKGLED